MTAPLDVLISVVLSGAVALACRGQLRVSSRSWYATRYFTALSTFLLLLVLPSAAYRYFFHPDWAAMYLIEASDLTVPFSVACLVAMSGAGVGTFALGSHCARSHREWLILTVLALAVGGIFVVAALSGTRLGQVGTYAQWHGSFGLRPLFTTDLWPALLVMGGCVLVVWIVMLVLYVREGVSFIRSSQ